MLHHGMCGRANGSNFSSSFSASATVISIATDNPLDTSAACLLFHVDIASPPRFGSCLAFCHTRPEIEHAGAIN
jgi:hypothetical protein